MIQGEIISDSASGQLYLDFLAAHFPGKFYYMTRKDENINDAFSRDPFDLPIGNYSPFIQYDSVF